MPFFITYNHFVKVICNLFMSLTLPLVFFLNLSSFIWTSLVAQTVQHLPTMRETRFQSLGKVPWRRQWHPTPVFLPGKSHGRRSLVGYDPWGRTWLSDFPFTFTLSGFGGWLYLCLSTTWFLKNNLSLTFSSLSLPLHSFKETLSIPKNFVQEKFLPRVVWGRIKQGQKLLDF